MVRDNVTGLVWEVKEAQDGTADYTNPHDADKEYHWCDTNPDTNGGDQGTCGTNDTEDFINALNDANFGGSADWRLPTLKELVTLVDYSRADPSIDPVFPSTVSSNYWSSTTYAVPSATYSTYNAWQVLFLTGQNHVGSGIDDNNKSSSYYVRAVRVGQCGSLGYSTVIAPAGSNGGLDPATPSPQTVANGSAAMFTFNADTGYHLTTVSGCGIDYSNTDDHTVSTYTTWTRGITADCTVNATFAANRYYSISASFALDEFSLDVTLQGKGTGSVTSSSGTITCPGTCADVFEYNTSVTLVAIADKGFFFKGWSGDCSGTGPSCTVTMDQTKNVTARFEPAFPWTMFLPALTKQ